MNGGFLFQALVYLGAAVVAVPLAKRLGLGSVLGYLVAGIVIGPFVLGFIGDEGQDVLHFAEFGVVLMLFLIGLELKPSLLWKLRIPILGMGGFQVGVTAAIATGIGLALGLAWQTAVAVGLTLALSSTAIVLQGLTEKGLLKTDGGQNSLSILLFQDIAVIPMLAILPLLALPGAQSHAADTEHAETLIGMLPVGAQAGITVGVVVVVILAGRFLVGPAFRLIAKTGLRELFTAASLFLVVGIALLMSAVGLSPALGTFLAGVVLAGSEYRHELETDIEPFKGLLLGLFFIAVGASIDFGIIGENPLRIAGLVGLLVVGKMIVLLVLGIVFRLGVDNTLLGATALAQGGEFAFVLLSFALQNNAVEDETAGLLVAVVALSMAISPLMLVLYDKVIRPRVGTREKVERPPDVIDRHDGVIIAGFGRVGSTIGRFLRANGVEATYLDVNPDTVDLLRKLGVEVYYGDASRHDLLKAAGAADAKLLIVAVDDVEKSQTIVSTAQKHFGHLKILVRSVSWSDTYDHMEAGVEKVYRETFGTAMTMATDALALTGFRRHFSRRAANRFRRHEQQMLDEFVTLRHDEKRLQSRAKERLKALEDAMREDAKAPDPTDDAAWDNTSLAEDAAKYQSSD